MTGDKILIGCFAPLQRTSARTFQASCKRDRAALAENPSRPVLGSQGETGVGRAGTNRAAELVNHPTERLLLFSVQSGQAAARYAPERPKFFAQPSGDPVKRNRGDSFLHLVAYEAEHGELPPENKRQ